MIEIRAAVPTDIPDLIELWHERALLQRLRLDPDAHQVWSAEVRYWLDDSETAIYVAISDSQLIGYIIGQVQTSSHGLVPDRIGVVSELALDLHQYQVGVGTLLVDVIRQWFRSCKIERIYVSVSQRSPVEQAFWRALGAVKWMENLWIM